jgi:uncharacterized membrane protein
MHGLASAQTVTSDVNRNLTPEAVLDQKIGLMLGDFVGIAAFVV